MHAIITSCVPTQAHGTNSETFGAEAQHRSGGCFVQKFILSLKNDQTLVAVGHQHESFTTDGQIHGVIGDDAP